MGSSVYDDLTWEEDTATQGWGQGADPAVRSVLREPKTPPPQRAAIVLPRAS